MKYLADTHLHLYPCFDLDLAFSRFLNRFTGEDKQIIRMACLAERSDCNLYDQLRTGKKVLAGFNVTPGAGHSLILQRKSDSEQLVLLPGRQIITAENIEVLALCCTANYLTGTPAAELITAIQDKGGIPVLPWSPGKWFFKRGRVIDALLQQCTSSDFLIGDVSLRPRGWATPLLLRKAHRLGYTIVNGSDPLPFKSEENCFGMYGSRIITTEKESSPEQILHSLLQGKATVTSFGQRSSPPALLSRLLTNARVKGVSRDQ